MIARGAMRQRVAARAAVYLCSSRLGLHGAKRDFSCSTVASMRGTAVQWAPFDNTTAVTTAVRTAVNTVVSTQQQRNYGTSKIGELVKEKKKEREKTERLSTSTVAGEAAKGNLQPAEAYTLPHPLWEDYDVHGVKYEHREPKTFIDKLAYATVRMIRFNFDTMSGFKFGKKNENKWLTRVIFLETIAGVPGSIAATLRHLSSLRRMKRDHGWIHTLLEEAENERMHLLTALTMKQPGPFFKLCVLASQGIFYNFFFLSYLVSSKFCHRLVGYIEEEAVHTYTTLIEDIDHGTVQHWKTAPAPAIAKKYWHLSDDATVRDVFLVIRADEAHHRDVNHTFGDMKRDDVNPFGLGM